ncbi:MAG: hypothetical protein ACPGQL_00385 [Thermoplasmatota archaeon]
MSLGTNLAVGALLVVAAALTALAWLAWTQRRSPKVLLLAVGFSLFLLKGAVLTGSLFTSAAWADDLLLPMVLFDLGVLTAFYAAVVRPARP